MDSFYYCTGAINTFPVPRYTFTSPSPLAAEPINDFPERSTVKQILHFKQEQCNGWLEMFMLQQELKE